MPEQPLVSCPHCEARFRAKDRTVLGRKMRCPRCREAFVAEECGDERDESAGDDQPVRLPPPKSRPARPRAKRKPLSKATVRLIVRCCVVVAVIVAAGFGVFSVDWKTLAGRTGLFTDTPEKLASRLEKVRAEAQAAVASGGNDKATTDKVNAAERELADLLLRVSRLEPIPDADYDELLQRHPGAFANSSGGGEGLATAVQGLTRSPAAGPTNPRERMQDRKMRSELGLGPDQQYKIKETHEVRDPFGKVMGQWVVVEHETQAGAAARRSAQTRAGIGKLLSAVSTLALRTREDAATNALRFGLRRIPEPRGAAEERQATVVSAVRGLNRNLANVASAGDFDQLLPEFASATERVKGAQAAGAAADEPQEERTFAADLYRPYAMQSVLQMSALLSVLEGRYQLNDRFRGAVVDFRTALPDRALAAILGRFQKADVRKSAAPTGFDAPSSSLPFGISAPSEPSEPPASGLSARMQSMIDEFVERNGKDKVLLVKLTGRALADAERMRYLGLVQKLTGRSSDSVAFGLPGATVIGVLYAGDLDAIASRVDFGTVTQTDDDERTITIDVLSGGAAR